MCAVSTLLTGGMSNNMEFLHAAVEDTDRLLLEQKGKEYETSN